MKQLNKIIFINSAHIPYAEIRVDGNVHFVGTQGVGKSTVLRALLFFYNADKQKLGIASEKRPFDEFYFPAQNSFIIYQVEGKGGYYFVAAYSSKNRVCFRFADTQFRKEFFIASDGNVITDWSEIRKKLSIYNAMLSNQIDSYETYKNIIYGNKNEIIKKEYLRFSILESPKYQNIPRTIQNVFLNTKLDGEFIKDTIISSMSDENTKIDMDLDFYRKNIADFTKQYGDIEKWHTKDPSTGKVKVRAVADNIITNFDDLIILKNTMKENCAKLNFVYENCQKQIPDLENKLTELENEKNELSRLYNEEESKYKADRDNLNREIGVCDNNLKTCKRKKEEYRLKNIDGIISLIDSEPVFMTKLDNLKSSLNTITSKFKSVDEKYNLLINKAEQDLNEFCISEDKILSDLVTKVSQEKEKLLNEKSIQIESLQKQYHSDIEKINAEKTKIQSFINSLEIKKTETKLKRYFKDEVLKIEESIEKLKSDLSNSEKEKIKLQSKIDSLRTEFKNFSDKTAREAEFKISDFETKNKELLKQIENLQNILDKTKNSFYEWLENNIEGWENTIGKIADEDTVLYNTNLNPLRTDNYDSVFGVKIDLDSIERQVRRPEDLRLEKEKLELQISGNKSKIAEILAEKEDTISAENKKVAAQISRLNIEMRKADNLVAYLPQQIKNKTADKDNLLRKEDELRQEEITKIEVEIRNNKSKLSEFEVKISVVNSTFEREKGVVEKKYSTKKTELENTVKEKETEISAAKESQKKETDKKISEYETARSAELKNEGADTQIIENLNIEITKVNQKLNEIENNREVYFNFQKDKTEYFDKEDEMQLKKKTLSKKLEDIDEKYSLRRQKLILRQRENEEQKNSTANLFKNCKEGVTEIEKFKVSDICPEEMQDAGKTETFENWESVVKEIQASEMRKSHLVESIKKNVNTFNSFFESSNTFEFKLLSNDNESFLNFAQTLKDFVNENRIEDYRRQISHNYYELMLRISKETGDLLKFSSDISKIILDINHDFEEKIFAGVIKKIALRHKQSDSPLMQILIRIKDFCAENSFNLQEPNLFSVQTAKNDTSAQLDLLFRLSQLLQKENGKKELSISDTFKLEFSVTENDNDTGWKEKISAVGSDGTDILVKAMINIMLINVFKEKVSKKSGDFSLHCMMDEIGKLHPNNVAGILDFANSRNIYLLNSSPMTYNVSDYKYTYYLEKDKASNTRIKLLVSKK